MTAIAACFTFPVTSFLSFENWMPECKKTRKFIHDQRAKVSSSSCFDDIKTERRVYLNSDK